MSDEMEQFDLRARVAIYDAILTQGAIPSQAEIVAALASSQEAVTEAFRRLAQAHVIVLQPGRDEILMANPFSATPTAFQVEANDRMFWGNCVWDALGILAMLRADGRLRASCADCGAAMTLTVKDGALVDLAGIAHFAVPAKQWWENIVYT